VSKIITFVLTAAAGTLSFVHRLIGWLRD